MSKTIGMTTIRHVFGNTLRLAIPLTLRTVMLVDGTVTTTDSDFTPTGNVVVVFGQTARQVEFPASMRDGNVAVVVDYGTLPIGTYSITVLTHDSDGNPMRFKQRTVVKVVDATIDAGIDVGIEFESQEWLLNGAIFLAVQGVDGVGIDSITTNESSISGEYNTVTFNLTDGTSYTLHVRNGESTEQTLPANVVVDQNYVHTDNNYTDADSQKVSIIDKLFGDVSYDRISRRLNFFKYGDTTHLTPLKSIDITDFLRDGRVSRFSIVDGNLTIKLNSDGNNEEFKVPISSIVDLSNYYNKSQVDELISAKADSVEAMSKSQYLGLDGALKSEYSTQVVLYYMGEPYDEGIVTTIQTYQHIYENGNISYSNGSHIVSLGHPQSHIIYCNAKTNKLYRWTGSEFVMVGGGSSDGGMQATYSNGTITIIGSDSSQTSYSNGTITL